ncbi:MAG: hypothetical protein ABIU29_03725 [Chthoniobacterales bacterium]
MDLYDVMADGCHTPITSQQIADLFQAGQLDRHLPCKPLGMTTWRTIDELFPLLKYGQRGPSFDLDVPPANRAVWPFVVAAALIALLLSGLALHYWIQHSYDSAAEFLPDAILPVVAQMTPSPRYQPQTFHSSAKSYRNESGDTERLLAEKRQHEQTAREQAVLADQMRVNAERERQETKKAAGTDYHVALDQNQYIAMPGGGVWVKVHDNDVTTFDISINGGRWRQIPKQKGISHSRTDEAFVYNNGRASLYYVWEISGKINHCLLRVREN